MDRPSVLALQARLERARRELVQLQRRAAQLEVDVAAARHVNLRGAARRKARRSHDVHNASAASRKIPSKSKLAPIRVPRGTDTAQAPNAMHNPKAPKPRVPKAGTETKAAKLRAPKTGRMFHTSVPQITQQAPEVYPTRRPPDPDEAALLLVVQDAWPSPVSISDLSRRLHLPQEHCQALAQGLVNGHWMLVARTSATGDGGAPAEAAFLADL